MSRKSSTRVDLKKLDATRDEDIDYSEIPELGDDFFANAKRITPRKARTTPISVRLDTDVLEWLRAGGKGYQSRLNGILRSVMAANTKPVAAIALAQGARRVAAKKSSRRVVATKGNVKTRAR